MKDFLRTNRTLLGMILLWFITAVVAGPLLYLLLPLSVLFFRSRELWPEMLMGFLMVLVASDVENAIVFMRVVKSAKLGYVIVLALIFLMERDRFAPFARVWVLFTPFFIYSLFPIMKAANVEGVPVFVTVQKTISYILLYMVVPNYFIYCFRRQGWDFIRNLIHFFLFILVLQVLIPYLAPSYQTLIGGRYRGTFGNPNALAIFSFLFTVLFFTANQMNPRLFSRTTRVFSYAIIGLLLIKAGSRTSVVSTLMFLTLVRFFRISPILGFVSFISMVGAYELVSSNITAIVSYLGLENYLRVDSIEDGSGRYFAWEFAWEKLNEMGFFFFGGGFGTDEEVMWSYHEYLNSMGHQGGIHNSYLTLWFNTGIVGLALYMRGFFLLFFKSNKRVASAFAIMLSVLFSGMYESWLVGSLNPFTIVLLLIITLISEEEIQPVIGNEDPPEEVEAVPEVPQLVLPAR
ncbi:MAG: hypothetical protein QM724_07450 [Flavobacteriales bacterium]